MSLLKRLFGKKDPEEQENKKVKNTIQTLKINGLKAMKIGKFEHALAFFKNVLELNASDSDTHLYLSQVYVQMNELDAAQHHILKVIELLPNFVEAQFSLIQIYHLSEEYAKMLEVATKLTAQDATNSLAHYMQGVAYYKLGNLFEAIASLTRTLEINNYHIEALYLRAKILFEMKQYEEATKDIHQLLEREKDHEEALLIKGQIEEIQGNKEEAQASYTKIINLNPFNAKAYLKLSAYFTQLHQFEQAIAILNEAIELNPEVAQLYKQRGSLKLIQGDSDGAIQDTKIALELDPTIKDTISGQFKS